MNVDAYLLFGYLGPFLSFLFVVGAFPFLIYGVWARNKPRARTASRIALGLAVLAVLFSAILWEQLVTGYYRYDRPVDYHDPDFQVFEFIAGLEAVTLLLSIVAVARHKLRRSAPPTSA